MEEKELHTKERIDEEKVEEGVKSERNCKMGLKYVWRHGPSECWDAAVFNYKQQQHMSSFSNTHS